MPEFSDVKDSGTRQEFGTGAKRDIQTGKGRYDLLPPLAIRRIAKHYENGARKYGDRNWEKGMPMSRYADSALRHLFAYIEGMRDEDHLAAAVWNGLAMIHQEEMIERGLLSAELNDLPDYQPNKDTPLETLDKAKVKLNEAALKLQHYKDHLATKKNAD